MSPFSLSEFQFTLLNRFSKRLQRNKFVFDPTCGDIDVCFQTGRVFVVSSRHLTEEDEGVDHYIDWMGWCSWFHGMVMCFLVSACIILRTHLFIWTVFFPKFLFQLYGWRWLILIVQCVVGGIICERRLVDRVASGLYIRKVN